MAGVPVFAPKLLRDLYAGDSLTVDVSSDPAESLSIETEWGVRLTLR